MIAKCTFWISQTQNSNRIWWRKLQFFLLFGACFSFALCFVCLDGAFAVVLMCRIRFLDVWDMSDMHTTMQIVVFCTLIARNIANTTLFDRTCKKLWNMYLNSKVFAVFCFVAGTCQPPHILCFFSSHYLQKHCKYHDLKRCAKKDGTDGTFCSVGRGTIIGVRGHCGLWLVCSIGIGLRCWEWGVWQVLSYHTFTSCRLIGVSKLSSGFKWFIFNRIVWRIHRSSL